MEDFSKYNGEGTTLRKAQMRLLEMLIEVDRVCKKYNISYWLDGGTALGAARHGGFIPWDDDIDIALLRKDYKKLIKILPGELPDWISLQNAKNERYFHFLYSRIVDKNSLSDYGDNRVLNRKKMKYQGLFLDIFYVEKGLLPIKKIVSRIYQGAFFNKKNLGESKLKKALSIVTWPFISFIVLILRLFNFIIPSNNLIFGYGVPFPREFRYDEIFPTKTIDFEGCKVMGPNNIDSYLKRYFGDYMDIPLAEDRKTHAEKIEVYESKLNMEK